MLLWLVAALALPVGIMMFAFGLGAFGVLLILAGLGCWWLGYRPSYFSRSIAFASDGTIVAPDGLANGRAADDLSVGGIQTIEVLEPTYSGGSDYHRFTRQAMNVGFLMRDGETIYIGKNILKNDAREVVVKLTLALDEIRSGLGLASKPGRRAEDDGIIN